MFEISQRLSSVSARGDETYEGDRSLSISRLISQTSSNQRIFLPPQSGQSRFAPPSHFYHASESGAMPSWVIDELQHRNCGRISKPRIANWRDAMNVSIRVSALASAAILSLSATAGATTMAATITQHDLLRYQCWPWQGRRSRRHQRRGRILPASRDRSGSRRQDLARLSEHEFGRRL
jgi:hypothetical protein